MITEKIKGLLMHETRKTFRSHPDFSQVFTPSMPWEYFSHSPFEPRPVRFRFNRESDQNQAEREFLRGRKTREDLDLFVRLVGIEGVEKYFQWSTAQIRGVLEGTLEMYNLPGPANLY